MIDTSFLERSFPVASEAVFDKMLWTDWYDGITGGLVVRSQVANAYKLELLAWDLGQRRRIFVLSPYSLRDFDLVVRLLSRGTTPVWPKWDAAWPSRTTHNEQLIGQLDQLLRRQSDPQYGLVSEATFENIFAIRDLKDAALGPLPQQFDGLPFSDNFEYWDEYVHHR